jgi:BlaI family transcriptional regulator, penicillinase repressor
MVRKKQPDAHVTLSRREREILETLYVLKKATAAEIREALPRPPSYTAVRTHLTNLERKRCVSIESDGTRYIYQPTLPRDEMGKKAIGEAMRTFFDNKVELVVSTLIDQSESKISKEQLDRLAAIIASARKAGL